LIRAKLRATDDRERKSGIVDWVRQSEKAAREVQKRTFDFSINASTKTDGPLFRRVSRPSFAGVEQQSISRDNPSLSSRKPPSAVRLGPKRR